MNKFTHLRGFVEYLFVEPKFFGEPRALRGENRLPWKSSPRKKHPIWNRWQMSWNTGVKWI